MERIPLKSGTIIRFSDGTAYQIEELIGQGGSALVYEAVEVGTNSCMHFAIKEIYPVEKFQRDASGEITPINNDAFEMKSELIEMKKHILTRSARISQEAYQSIQQVLPERNIFERAELILPCDSTPSRVSNSYVLMDSLKEKGTSLQRRVDDYRRNGTAISLDYATRIMEAVLHVYGSLHEKGFIHGDCQMNNILLLNTSQVDEGKSIVGVELIDFGCGRKLEEDGKTEVISDSLYSTDGYRAPEILHHVANFRMTPACDVWSLGFLFLNLLVEMPRWERIRRILNLSGTPFVITEYLQKNPSDKNISDTIGLNCSKAELYFANKILSRAMANNPEERYQNAGEMLLEIQALRRCINRDISMGIDAFLLWNSSILWTKNRAGAGLVRKIPSNKMIVYGKLGDEAEEPIVELLHKLEKRENRNLYLYAPGGAGKSFAVSELFNGYLENGIMIPLYLDLEKFTKDALEQLRAENVIMDDDIIPYLLARQYFEEYSKEANSIAIQIKTLLSNSIDGIEYYLVLDNLQKVGKELYSKAIRTLNHINLYFSNTWITVIGRAENPLVHDNIDMLKMNRSLNRNDMRNHEKDNGLEFEIPNIIKLDLLPKEYIFNTIEACWPRNFSHQDSRVIMQQHNVLGLPLFLNHYLKMLALKPDIEYLPNSTAELMMLYFAQLERNENTYGVHEILKTQLPYIGYQYMLSKKSTHTIEEIENWLKNECDVYYGEEYINDFLSICIKNLSILVINNNREISFVHDCFQDYFAAQMIAVRTKDAIRYRNVSIFKEINHYWPDTVNVIWPSLSVIELIDGNILKKTEEQTIIDKEFNIFISQYVDFSLYANKLPRNMIYWYFDMNMEVPMHTLTDGVAVGDMFSQYHMGRRVRYEHINDDGIVVEGNEALSMHYYHLAAEQGYALAQSNLAGIYMWGHQEHDMKKAIYWYQKAANQGECQAQYSLGEIYYCGTGVEVDLAEAVYWYRKAAENGVIKALRRLAVCFLSGWGGEVDKAQGIYWLTEAAKQGDASSQADLGYLYYNEYDDNKDMSSRELSEYWLRKAVENGNDGAKDFLVVYLDCKAAEQGDAVAQYKLGNAYRYAPTVNNFVKKAMYWYRKAAEQGLATAQEKLGYAYEYGEGIEVDKEQAVYWYRKAAEQGLVTAQEKLGYAYEYGEGIEVDKEQAVYWYRKAAEQGLVTTQEKLGYAYEHGEGIEVDKEKAVYWYRKAAEQGLAVAQNNLGYAYEHGEGIEVDKEKAVYWYRKAAKQGNSVAQNNLANKLCDGIGCKQDYEEALHWFIEAWKQGNISATNNLGWMYLNGYGIDAPNYEIAFFLFTEAAEQGSNVSEKHLAEMYIKGLGVPIDLRLALEHYTMARFMGSTDVDEQIEQLIKQLSEIGE